LVRASALLIRDFELLDGGRYGALFIRRIDVAEELGLSPLQANFPLVLLLWHGPNLVQKVAVVFDIPNQPQRAASR
jgi:hypothetical protein